MILLVFMLTMQIIVDKVQLSYCDTLHSPLLVPKVDHNEFALLRLLADQVDLLSLNCGWSNH
jgi:hypothetical protein